MIVSEENIEKILTEENKKECRKEGYELVALIEYNSLKTVVIKQLDYMIDSFTDQEVVDSIHDLNDWAEVEDLYRLPTTSEMIKIRFTSQQMVQTATNKGYCDTPPVYSPLECGEGDICLPDTLSQLFLLRP